MVYEFKCENNHIQDEVAPISKGPPKEVFCKECGGKMWQDLSSVTLKIPEYMRATPEGNLHSEIVNRMKHAKRPSGKDKVYY